MSQEPIVTKRIFDSYIAFTKNSAGSRSWQSYYADVDGVKTEVTRGGDLSCAFFVSSVLRIFNLIDSVHLTTASTQKDMVESGWVKIDKVRAGAVVVYASVNFGSESYPHIGICLSKTEVISNSTLLHYPTVHLLDMPDEAGKKRDITGLYWHNTLGNKGD